MNSPALRPNGLEFRQNLARQQRMWTFQRLGWVGIALIIVAASGGLFGSGHFARTVTMDDRRLVSLEYDRFGRYEGELVFRFTLSPEALATQPVTIWVNRAYWTDHAVEHILPEPTGTKIESDGFVYTFATGTTNASGVVIFRLRPEHVGRADGQFRVNEQGSVQFHQLIFP